MLKLTPPPFHTHTCRSIHARVHSRPGSSVLASTLAHKGGVGKYDIQSDHRAALSVWRPESKKALCLLLRHQPRQRCGQEKIRIKVANLVNTQRNTARKKQKILNVPARCLKKKILVYSNCRNVIKGTGYWLVYGKNIVLTGSAMGGGRKPF